MTREARQEALERHGLVESGDGFTVTLKGFQKAAERARGLRAQGNQEAALMLALEPSDPVRWEYARCLQIDTFSTEAYESGF
ncbi:hypothetical protein RB625_31260 [Streptomyces californicus]|uniref:hypothetical protein n=1 Tax=Streptomyces californicus TaxID=67351 RepID=UPI00296E4297|nr:hypothetical protein [Streptomyces californicus]MDW4902903.1 hypothetical protein [Streptomyces californicus]